MFREADNLAEDIRRAFEELERAAAGPSSGECEPALDVVETAAAIEVVIDLPGVESGAVRVVARGDAVLIVGEKRPAASPPGPARFHLVERGFGRFARVVRLAGAFDMARATATLRRGELRLALPKIEEQRGREIVIPIRTQADGEADDRTGP